jgi:hypothetical protein
MKFDLSFIYEVGISRDSSVGIVTGLRAGQLGFYDSWQALGIFLFATVFTPGLGRNQPPIQWVPGAPFVGLKRPGREAEHSPPFSAEFKSAWSYPQYVFMV